MGSAAESLELLTHLHIVDFYSGCHHSVSRKELSRHRGQKLAFCGWALFWGTTSNLKMFVTV